jgi:hypothetical protein
MAVGLRRVGQVVAPADARSKVAVDDQVEHIADAGPQGVLVRHMVEHLRVGQQDAGRKVSGLKCRNAHQVAVEDMHAVAAQRQAG